MKPGGVYVGYLRKDKSEILCEGGPQAKEALILFWLRYFHEKAFNKILAIFT